MACPLTIDTAHLINPSWIHWHTLLCVCVQLQGGVQQQGDVQQHRHQLARQHDPETMP